AALCFDGKTAEGARKWNQANVLAMSLRLTSKAIALEILDAWFGTKWGTGEDAENVAKLTNIEKKYK
ncbi:RpiB/LacA/LacB family sugar-phosphate isomerase, partial [Chloroflexota bacterium]